MRGPHRGDADVGDRLHGVVSLAGFNRLGLRSTGRQSGGDRRADRAVRGASPILCGNVTCFLVWAACTGLALFNGGGTAPSVTWYATLPVVSLLLCGPWAGISWTLVGLLSLAAFALAETAGYACPSQLTPAALKVLEYLGAGCLVACQFILVIAFRKIDHRSRQALQVVNEELKEARSQLEAVQSNLDFPIAQWAKIHQKIESLEDEVEEDESDSDVSPVP